MSAIAQKSRVSRAPARAAVSSPTLKKPTFARKLKDGRWVGTGQIEDLNRELREWRDRVGKHDVILLDRPWAYGKKPGAPGGKSWALNPEWHYPVIADGDNIRIALRDVLKPHAEIFEWVPSSQLKFLLDIWAAAGVQHVGAATWWKLTEQGGSHVCSNQTIGNCHEMLVHGRVGNGVPRIENAAVKRVRLEAEAKATRDGLDNEYLFKGDLTEWEYAVAEAVGLAGKAARDKANARIQRINGVFVAPAGAHSAKPEMVHEWLRSIYGPGKTYGEIFCRGTKSGWNVFGNQAEEQS